MPGQQRVQVGHAPVTAGRSPRPAPCPRGARPRRRVRGSEPGSRPGPAPQSPAVGVAAGQGADPVPLDLEEVLGGVERRGLHGQHGQERFHHADLLRERPFALGPNSGGPGLGRGCKAATLCRKASSRPGSGVCSMSGWSAGVARALGPTRPPGAGRVIAVVAPGHGPAVGVDQRRGEWSSAGRRCVRRSASRAAGPRSCAGKCNRCSTSRAGGPDQGQVAAAGEHEPAQAACAADAWPGPTARRRRAAAPAGVR